MVSLVRKLISKLLGLDTSAQSETAGQLLVNNKKKINEVYWGLVFNNAITESNWLLKKQFNVGRWAAGYPLLYILYRIYNDIKPLSILEFGLGESSKLLYQYQQSCADARFTVIEHDTNWMNFFSNQTYDLTKNIILLDLVTKEIKGHEVLEYKGLLEKISGQKFDLVTIDGPFGSEHYSRHQIVEMIENDLLADDFIIILDDYERKGEKQTGSDIKEALKQKNKIFEAGIYYGEKDTLLVCSPKYKFITTL